MSNHASSSKALRAVSASDTQRSAPSRHRAICLRNDDTTKFPEGESAVAALSYRQRSIRNSDPLNTKERRVFL
jgi:hypothetical protein